MSKLIKSMTLLILSLCPLWVTAARVSPVTLSFQNGFTRFATSDTGSANYLVSMDASMPTGLSLSLSPSDYSWVTQVTTGRSACTSPAAPICATQFSLSPGSSCCLMLGLSSAGVAVGSYSLSPIVSTTPATYQYTVTSPTPVTVIVATEVLTSSVSSLGLKMGGNPRQVTITNSSTTNTAFNVNFSYSALPADTTIKSNITSTTTCGNIAPLGTCILTVTPGNTPSAVPYYQNPTPITLTIVGGNTNRLTLPVDILTYGSVYQSGFIYSIDDTNLAGSIGGKVAALTDQQATAQNGIIWSSDSSGSVDYNIIYGISDNSTTVSADPSGNFVPDQTPCNGATDGSCNSGNIITYYSPPKTNPAITSSSYAAGLCKAIIGGYSDWYLPAICEMGPASVNGLGDNAGCVQGTDNMVEKLPALLLSSCTGTSCLSGDHWSSTEVYNASNMGAWDQIFSPSGGSLQASVNKDFLLSVRCSRALTP